MGFWDSLCDVASSAVDAVCENPVKSVLIAGATIATGGAALAAASAIGATVSEVGLGRVRKSG